MNLKIGVLCGGLSAERDVSLRTGEAIYKALVKNGYDAIKIDVDKNIAEKVKDTNINLAFIALHGKYGEDGTIQGLLEILGIPYTGSDVLASATAINKIATKKIMAYEGIPTPDYFAVTQWEYKNKPDFYKQKVKSLGLPVVIKAATQGSTIGISFVKEMEQLNSAFDEAFKYDDSALVEKMINGIEITASVLGNENPLALPLIEIVSATGVYDYEAKYTVGLSDHIIPPRINDELQEEIKKLAIETYKAVGCKGLARVDFMVEENGNAYALEVNTIPGMTETSLFPDAAKAAGITFEELVKRIIDLTVTKIKTES